jgi:hypothetical protein
MLKYPTIKLVIYGKQTRRLISARDPYDEQELAAQYC